MSEFLRLLTIAMSLVTVVGTTSEDHFAFCGDLENAIVAWDEVYRSNTYGRFEYESVEEKVNGHVEVLDWATKQNYLHEFEYDFTNGKGWRAVTRVWPDGRRDVSGSNSLYDFVISRKSDQGSWLIDSLVKNPSYDKRFPAANYLKTTERSAIQSVSRLRFPGLVLPMHVPIAALVRSPSFRLNQTSDAVLETGNCRRWNFSFAPPVNSAESVEIPYREGEILLIPEKNWQVHSAVVECELPGEKFKSIYRVEYVGDDRKSLGRSSTMLNQYREGDQDKTYAERLTIKPLEPTAETVSENRYRLSYYGLNEPVFARFSWWRSLILLVLSVFALIASAFLYRYARKN